MIPTDDERSLPAERVVRDSCPLRRSFVERPEGVDEPTPLARLLRTQGDVGGKGGGLRVSLLLSLDLAVREGTVHNHTGRQLLG